jgi:hypothetical protein
LNPGARLRFQVLPLNSDRVTDKSFNTLSFELLLCKMGMTVMTFRLSMVAHTCKPSYFGR